MGKQGDVSEKGQASRVVRDLITNLGPGYNITTDNFYTSLPLAKELLERNLTLVGTLRKSKREIPSEMLEGKKRIEGSSIFCFTDYCTMVSYMPKRDKLVLLLSTMHHDDAITQVRIN